MLVVLLKALPAQITDSNGLKQGYWKKKDAANRLVYEGEFKDDKPVGTFKYYYPTDTVRAVMKFRNEGKVAYAKLFHPNGKKMAEGKYVNKEVKDSTWIYYDEAGVLISKENYKSGKKNGACYVYFPDGKVSEEKTYRDDVLNGDFKEYFDSQVLKSKGQYVNGQLEGRISYFYPNGVEVAAGFYKNGSKNVPWIYKTECGKIREKELYRNGKLAGEKETTEFFSKTKTLEQADNTGTKTKPNQKKQ
jgi:antitoxin component YwqK of YwqJK toxin-antitoxin module